MSRMNPAEEMNLDLFDPRLEAIGKAIQESQQPGREGPFGLYDYTDYGHPVPHHVRDFRDYSSSTYGDCLFQSKDPDLARQVYERLTIEHMAIAAIKATFKAFGLDPLNYIPANATAEQREEARSSTLYSRGDMQLAWVNSGDLLQHSHLLPSPDSLGVLANQLETKKVETADQEPGK